MDQYKAIGKEQQEAYGVLQNFFVRGQSSTSTYMKLIPAKHETRNFPTFMVILHALECGIN